MFKAGIIDPTKVVRTSLQNAASIAGVLITTEAMVADALKTKLQRLVQCLTWVAWVAWVA